LLTMLASQQVIFYDTNSSDERLTLGKSPTSFRLH